jgi:DNA-binding CsgD family transcriptional regulator
MQKTIFKTIHPDDDAWIRLGQANSLVEALNQASELDGVAHDKVRLLLQAGAAMFGPSTDCQVLLYSQLQRRPAPKLADRVWWGPVFEQIEPRGLGEVQRLLDLCGPGLYPSVPEAARNSRTPVVIHFAEDSDPEWYQQTYVPDVMEPKGWSDTLTALWSASPKRVVSLNVFRRKGEPAFDSQDRRKMSLFVRAAAPLVDREMFKVSDMGLPELSPPQRSVLVRLLRGESEKQIAAGIYRSPHTVHSHVKAIHDAFKVSSRGELLARFVDQRLVDRLGTT